MAGGRDGEDVGTLQHRQMSVEGGYCVHCPVHWRTCFPHPVVHPVCLPSHRSSPTTATTIVHLPPPPSCTVPPSHRSSPTTHAPQHCTVCSCPVVCHHRRQSAMYNGTCNCTTGVICCGQLRPAVASCGQLLYGLLSSSALPPCTVHRCNLTNVPRRRHSTLQRPSLLAPTVHPPTTPIKLIKLIKPSNTVPITSTANLIRHHDRGIMPLANNPLSIIHPITH